MKKFITLLLVVFMVCSLAACNKAKKTTTVCTANYEGVDVVNTIISADDKVESVVYKNTLTVDESLAPYIEAAVQEYADQIKDIKGVSYAYEIDGSTLTETTTINYLEADMSALIDLGIIESQNGEVPTFIEYESSIQNMKDIGCTCEVK